MAPPFLISVNQEIIKDIHLVGEFLDRKLRMEEKVSLHNSKN